MVVNTREHAMLQLAAALGLEVRWRELGADKGGEYTPDVLSITISRAYREYKMSTAKALAHEIAHHLGPELRYGKLRYAPWRAEHECYAHTAATIALGATADDTRYIAVWAENRVHGCTWPDALASIVGEHIAAAIAVAERGYDEKA